MQKWGSSFALGGLDGVTEANAANRAAKEATEVLPLLKAALNKALAAATLDVEKENGETNLLGGLTLTGGTDTQTAQTHTEYVSNYVHWTTVVKEKTYGTAFGSSILSSYDSGPLEIPTEYPYGNRGVPLWWKANKKVESAENAGKGIKFAPGRKDQWRLTPSLGWGTRVQDGQVIPLLAASLLAAFLLAPVLAPLLARSLAPLLAPLLAS